MTKKELELLEKEASDCIDSMMQSVNSFNESTTEQDVINGKDVELDLYYLGAFETIMRILNALPEYTNSAFDRSERLNSFYLFCLEQEVA